MHGDFGPAEPDSTSGARQEQSYSPEARISIRKIYKIILFVNILINLDHGIIPAATTEIKRDLELNDVKLGILGSVVYAGLVCGSLLAGYLFQTYVTKHIICFMLALNCIALGLFPITNNMFLLSSSRLIVGFCQVFLVIFFPVWVDKYGEANKTMWLTYLQLGVPLGIVTGYIITAFYNTYNMWRGSFFTQLVLLIPCFLLFAWEDPEYLSAQSDMAKAQEVKLKEQEAREEFFFTLSQRSSEDDDYVNDIDELLIGSNEPLLQNTKIMPDEDEQLLKNTKISYFNNIKILFSKRIFISTMFAIAALYFVVTGIQFWISDYLREELHASREKVYIWFAICSITAPTSGVIFGTDLSCLSLYNLAIRWVLGSLLWWIQREICFDDYFVLWIDRDRCWDVFPFC